MGQRFRGGHAIATVLTCMCPSNDCFTSFHVADFQFNFSALSFKLKFVDQFTEVHKSFEVFFEI